MAVCIVLMQRPGPDPFLKKVCGSMLVTRLAYSRCILVQRDTAHSVLVSRLAYS